MKRFLIWFVWSIAILCPLSVLIAEETAPAAVYQKYVVAADHPAASAAGLQVLQRGGNVVDAAVATSFALSVVRPSSCGIGGGGFMVIWDAEQQSAVALDYRERAPLAAKRNMFMPADAGGGGLSSRWGGAAAAIPGTVAGLCYAHAHYGKLQLRDVLAPAIRLADEGVAIDEHDIETQQDVLKQLAEIPSGRQRFAVLYDKYLNGGRPWKLGDRFQSPQGPVLRRIAEQGRDAFYQGPVAEALVRVVAEQGGIWAEADLKQMDVTVRQPLIGGYRGDTIYTMPPPSSGGIALLETLNILEAYRRVHPQSRANPWPRPASSVHLIAEALKHAFADRAEFLGDTDFVSVPVQRLISRPHAATLAGRIEAQRVQSPEAYGRFAGTNDGGTSHFSILDAEGNGVACTETINTLFGSLVVEPTYGIVLNNEMDDFAAVPGQPNVFGLIQSEANAVAPRKRPLSSMTPTVVVRDGKAMYAVGASGGPRIISATLQVLLNLIDHHRDVRTAVSAARFHHQWMPDVLYLEGPLDESLSAPLAEKGHQIKRSGGLAATQAAARTENGLQGASDPRKAGAAAGE